jgi:uncharacterized membrane protein
MENKKMENQKSALGLDGNVTALIGYLFGIVALILIFIEKDNKFVRFHALQSVLWFVAFIVGLIVVVIVGTVLSVVLSLIGAALELSFIGFALGWGINILLYLGLFLGFFGGLILAAIKSFGGAETKLPVVGNMAQKWV